LHEDERGEMARGEEPCMKMCMATISLPHEPEVWLHHVQFKLGGGEFDKP